MIPRNSPQKRCLILSNDYASLIPLLKTALSQREYHYDIVGSRKVALKYFIQYRHFLFLLEADFLPRFPHRLMQFFKMAHRTPGVIIFNAAQKDVAGYSFLKDGVITLAKLPYSNESIDADIKETVFKVDKKSRELFIRNLLVYIAIAVPIVVLLVLLFFGVVSGS